MRWNVQFYQRENGDIPAYEFLCSLPPKLQAKAFSEIELLEKCGTALKEPYAKPLVGRKYQGRGNCVCDFLQTVLVFFRNR